MALDAEAVRGVYRCFIDSEDFCAPQTDDRCLTNVATARSADAAYKTYNDRCANRERECGADAGLGDYPCGPPAGESELMTLLRPEIYSSLMHCFDTKCSAKEINTCVRETVGCFGE